MKLSRSFLLTVLVVLNTGCDGENEVPGPVPIETREVERSPVERPSAPGVPPGLERFSVSRGFLHPNGRLSQDKEDGWLPRVFVHLDVIRDLFPWPIRKFEFRWGGPDSNYNTGIPGDKRSAWTWGQTGIVYPCGVRYGLLCNRKFRIPPF